MKKVTVILAILSMTLASGGCYSKWPASFSYTVAPRWTSIEIRDGVEYDRAWNTVFNLLARDFDMVTVHKEEGYIQTGWLNTWGGLYQDNYKVRVTVKFAANRRTLQMKTEAWAMDDGKWYIGTDSRLMATLKTDLMGTVGRTTR